MKSLIVSTISQLRILSGSSCAALCVAAMLVQVPRAQAQVVLPLPIYEPFAWPENERLGLTGSSAAIWSIGNSTGTGSATNTITAALSYPGLQTSNGSAGIRLSGAPTSNRNRGILFTNTLAGTNPTLYASFLLNVQLPPSATKLLCSLANAGVGSSGPGAGAVVAGLFVDAAGKLSIVKNSLTTPASGTTFSLVSNVTYFVVMRYRVVTNGNADDQVALWLNPAGFGVSEANVPAPTLTTTNNGDQTFAQSFWLNQLVGNPGGTFWMDELRIATNWAGVTPASCSPGTAFNVTGGGSICLGGNFPVGLSGSQVGVDYWLATNGVFTEQVINGTGSSLSFGLQSVTAIYTVLGSNVTSGCTGWMNTNATVSILASPGIAVQPTAQAVASGGLAVFSVGATGDGLLYQWRRDGTNLPNAGNISGANSPTLLISPSGPADAVAPANGYDVVISGSCAPPTNSAKVGLTLRTPADIVWQGDFGANVWDIATTTNFSQGLTPVVFYNGDRVTFGDSPNSPITLGSPYLSPSTITMANQGGLAFTNAGHIIGSGTSLAMVGGGSLNMNSANSYGGGTLITNGVININTPGALGTGPVVLAGGSLNFLVSLATLSNAINVVADSALSGGNVEPQLAGALTGSAGTLALSASTTLFRPRLYGNFVFDRPITIDANTILRLYGDTNGTGQQVFNGVISGAGRVERRSPGAEGDSVFNAANTYAGGTLLRGGGIGFGANSVASSPPTIDSSPVGTGTLTVDDTAGDTRKMFAVGGPRMVANPITTLSGTNAVGVVIIGTNDLTLSGDLTLGTADFTVTADNAGLTTLGGVISSAGGGLIKNGTNALALSGINTYIGSTVVGAGTLLVNGQIDVGAVTVTNGTLGGTGIILGPVDVQGGVLAPGASVGTLSISNTLALGLLSTTRVEVNKTAGTSDLVRGLTSVTYGGILTVSNISGSLTTNDVFKIFDAASYGGSFLTVAPASPQAGLAWSTSTLAVDGRLRLVAASGPNTSRTNITFGVNGSTLTLSWPADHTGWALQAQTNSRTVGLATNWAIVPGSTATNRIDFPINPANGSVFFRLILP